MTYLGKNSNRIKDLRRRVRRRVDNDFLDERLIRQGYLERYKVLVFCWGNVIEPDVQGRVAVSSEMLGTVGIARKVSVVGVGSYMELWDPEALADGGPGETTLDEGFVNEFFR